jgi:hypothetical protein
VKAKQSDPTSNMELMKSLTEEEQKCAKRYWLVSVIGENNQNNFILFDPMMKSAIQLIINNRAVGQISSQNPCVFAVGGTKASFIRHSIPMKRFAEELQEENVSSRSLRKHVSTTVQKTIPVLIEGGCVFRPIWALVSHKEASKLKP